MCGGGRGNRGCQTLEKRRPLQHLHSTMSKEFAFVFTGASIFDRATILELLRSSLTV